MKNVRTFLIQISDNNNSGIYLIFNKSSTPGTLAVEVISVISLCS